MSQTVKLRVGEDKQIFFPESFPALSRCPHCGISNPNLMLAYSPERARYSTKFQFSTVWAAYECSSCALPISLVHAERKYVGNDMHEHEYLVYPSSWSPDDAIPERPAKYLQQASSTISSPDASVVMSGSAVDAMLKEKGLKEGNLYNRIDQAVKDGILTNDMSQWAHLVRLNSNNPRHADDDKPHMSKEDAKRSLEFARALADVLFVLPNKMPLSIED